VGGVVRRVCQTRKEDCLEVGFRPRV